MRVGIKFFLNITLLCAIACSSSPAERGKESGTGKETAQSSAALPSPTSTSPVNDRALAAVRELGAARSFRAYMTTIGKPSEGVITKTDVILPDRFRIVSKQYEIITVGTDTYMKLSNQEWQKLSAGTSAGGDVTNLTDPKKLEAYLSTATEITSLGLGKLDGAAVQVYQARFNYLPSSKAHLNPQPFTARLWVGESDGRLRKLEGKAAHSPSTTTVYYYDYDARFDISLPIG
jgi:hypothetical protein